MAPGSKGDDAISVETPTAARSRVARDGKKVLTGSFDNTARVWDLDARPVLWRQAGVCLPAARREILLGEAPERARAGHDRRRALAERCRSGFDPCRQAVTEAFGTSSP
jgi:hypothetical protein